MSIAITPLYAAPLAVLMMVLVGRVVWFRRRYRVGIGAGDHKDLSLAIRAHANGAETIPIAVLLLLLAELAGAAPWLLHGAGLALLVGRIWHAAGLSHHGGMSAGRLWGMVLTMVAVVVLAVASVVLVLWTN